MSLPNSLFHLRFSTQTMANRQNLDQVYHQYILKSQFWIFLLTNVLANHSIHQIQDIGFKLNVGGLMKQDFISMLYYIPLTFLPIN